MVDYVKMTDECGTVRGGPVEADAVGHNAIMRRYPDEKGRYRPGTADRTWTLLGAASRMPLMELIDRALGCALLSTSRLEDNRGWFQIDFSVRELQEAGLSFDHVEQLNHSYTEHAGVVRGLNYQADPYAQAKVVSCIAGAVYSVGVDITPSSDTFGKWCGFELTPDNHRSMFVPRGYAHGFVTLRDGTELQYLTDNTYSYGHAKSVRFDDSDLDIDWTMNGTVPLRPDILSDKNRNAPYLRDTVR